VILYVFSDFMGHDSMKAFYSLFDDIRSSNEDSVQFNTLKKIRIVNENEIFRKYKCTNQTC